MTEKMKILIKIIIICFTFHSNSFAQQIKRWTLSSVGSQKVATPFRVSWTAGGCPGCGTLLSSDGKTYIRQGFQQPPNLFDNPSNCLVTAPFDISSTPSQSCGLRFDYEYTGSQTQGVTYEWDFGEGANPRTSKQANVLGVTYTTPGTKFISLTVKQGACTEASAKTVTVNANQIGFGGSATVSNINCNGAKTGAINVTTFGGTGIKTFRWSNGSNTPSLSNVVAGRYQVTITDGNSCSFNLDTVISQPAKPLSVSAAIVNETCKGYDDGFITLTTTGGTQPYRYIWSNNLDRVSLTNLPEGKYSVSISDSNSCKIDTVFEVKVRCKNNDNNNNIFDTFTPNGDNMNDSWVVKDIEKYPENELVIYNRWGQIVYNKTPYTNEWIGTTNDNKELPSAAYYYVIRLNNDKGTVLTGSITLVR